MCCVGLYGSGLSFGKTRCVTVSHGRAFSIVIINTKPTNSTTTLHLTRREMGILLVRHKATPNTGGVVNKHVCARSLRHLMPSFESHTPLRQGMAGRHVSVNANGRVAAVRCDCRSNRPGRRSCMMLHTGFSG